MTDEKPRLKGDQVVRLFEEPQMKTDTPPFRVGDTLDVGVAIREGGEAGKERIQVFRGICIARKGAGNRETITVRRMVQGEGVERIFPLHAPSVRSITVVRKGHVRRAKLHYLRGLTGRAARVKEDMRTRSEDESAPEAEA